MRKILFPFFLIRLGLKLLSFLGYSFVVLYPKLVLAIFSLGLAIANSVFFYLQKQNLILSQIKMEKQHLLEQRKRQLENILRQGQSSELLINLSAVEKILGEESLAEEHLDQAKQLDPNHQKFKQ